MSLSCIICSRQTGLFSFLSNSSLFFSSRYLLPWNVLTTSFWMMKSSLPASAALSQSIWPLASLKEKLKYNLLQDPELRSVLSSSLQQEVISLYFRYTPTAFHFIPLLPYAITYIYLFTSSMPWKLVESYGSSLQPQYPEQTFVIDWRDKATTTTTKIEATWFPCAGRRHWVNPHLLLANLGRLPGGSFGSGTMRNFWFSSLLSVLLTSLVSDV